MNRLIQFSALFLAVFLGPAASHAEEVVLRCTTQLVYFRGQAIQFTLRMEEGKVAGGHLSLLVPEDSYEIERLGYSGTDKYQERHLHFTSEIPIDWADPRNARACGAISGRVVVLVLDPSLVTSEGEFRVSLGNGWNVVPNPNRPECQESSVFRRGLNAIVWTGSAMCRRVAP